MMRVPLSEVAKKHAAKAAARAHACPVAVALVDELEHTEDGGAVKTVHECNTHQGFAVCVQAKELALLTMMQEPGVAPAFNGEPVAAADGSRAEGFAAVCLADGGVTLRSVLKRNSGVPQMLKWKAVCAAVEQVWTMHAYRVVHGDLNKDNLLVRFFHGDRELVPLATSSAAAGAAAVDEDEDDDDEEEIVEDMPWHEVVAVVTIIDYENKARYGASDTDLLVDRREFIEDQLPRPFSTRLQSYVNMRPCDGELYRVCLQVCPVDDDDERGAGDDDVLINSGGAPAMKFPRVPPTTLPGTGRKCLGGKSPAAMAELFTAIHGAAAAGDAEDDDDEPVRPKRRTKATTKSPAFRKAMAASKKATAGRNSAASKSTVSSGASKRTSSSKRNKKERTRKSVTFGDVSERIIKKTYKHERTTEIIVKKVVSAREQRTRGGAVSKPARRQPALSSRRSSSRSTSTSRISSSSSRSSSTSLSVSTTTIVAKAAAAWERGATHSCDMCSMLLTRGVIEFHERTDMIYQITPKQKPNHTSSLIFCGMCYQSYSNGDTTQKTADTNARSAKGAKSKSADKKNNADDVEILDVDGHMFEELSEEEIDDQQMADGHASDSDEDEDEDSDAGDGSADDDDEDTADRSPYMPERGLDSDTLHSMGLDSSSDEDN